ncbi:MAG: DHH family phosphoesterase, partial [Bdellovibrionales bacterium]|nr:DHH family phosphoesterase [Bdellovibrionales bacterium]
MESSWSLKNQEKVPDGAPPFPMPTVVWDWLAREGFSTRESIEKLLNPSLKDMRDPNRLDGMKEAVQRLVRARKENEKVVIYADFDLDGTSGLALLFDALKDLGFMNLDRYQPKRLSEGYGFHESAVEEIASWGTSVIVTVDVGTAAPKTAEKAKALGLDLIITDHHLPSEILPEAFAVINPNKGTCVSGLGHLSGTGVAFYLVLALKRELEEQGLLAQPIDLKKYLDVFVIGTISDMVPLVDENRALVRHGLHQILKTDRPGLKALIDESGLSSRKCLTTQDIGFSIAPKLNALSRLEADLMPIEVLMHDSPDAGDLIKRVFELNAERKEKQKLAEEIAFFEAEEQVENGVIFIYSKDFHKGVIGLVAVKLAQRFGVPAFVGSLHEDGTISGSSRVPDPSPFHLVEILGEGSSHLLQFGGHKEAAGFKLNESEASSFYESLKTSISKYDSSAPESYYDMEVHLKDI